MIHKQIKPVSDKERAELFAYWFRMHNWDCALIAKVTGVSRRTVERWRDKRDLPHKVAQLIDQIKHGPIVRYGTFRGPSSIRPERSWNRE